jgi:hypothetical protein
LPINTDFKSHVLSSRIPYFLQLWQAFVTYIIIWDFAQPRRFGRSLFLPQTYEMRGVLVGKSTATNRGAAGEESLDDEPTEKEVDRRIAEAKSNGDKDLDMK